MNWHELVPSPDAPLLRLVESGPGCQERPGQELIDRLDAVCYSVLPRLLAMLTCASGAGRHDI